MTDVPQSPAVAAGPRRPRAVLGIGKFDGVHAGHRHLAAHLLEEADRRGAEATVLVLHPHPGQVLRGHRTPILTDLATRRRRLLALGIHRVERLAFTPSLATLTPAAFVDRLRAHFDVAAFVVGPDFAFGAHRAGSADTLRQLGHSQGFDVVVVSALGGGAQQVSSGGIRQLLAAGRVEEARRHLRTAPSLTGTVVRGAARGRRLGFPTANLALAADLAVPANGIYAVTVAWRAGAGSHWSPGVASIGVRPTFDNGERLLEVHLLDFEGDLYGGDLTVAFIARLRDEEHFASVGALVDQMAIDAAAAREILVRETEAALQPATAAAPVGGEPLPPNAPRDGDNADGKTRRWIARGFDLGAACEAAAQALSGGGTAEAATRAEGAAPRHMAVQGSDEETVVAAWLRTSAGAERTHVYAANAAGAEGIVWGQGGPAPDALEVEAVDNRDGIVSIVFQTTTSTAAPSAGARRPGAAATAAGP